MGLLWNYGIIPSRVIKHGNEHPLEIEVLMAHSSINGFFFSLAGLIAGGY